MSLRRIYLHCALFLVFLLFHPCEIIRFTVQKISPPYNLISEYGTDVIDTHIAEGLAVTEKFIAKVKNSAKAV